MRIIRRDTYRRMPWKNGAGVTEEVAAFPIGSDMESFDWRISLAHIVRPCSFSAFPDVDRTIVLLDGDRLVLDIDDQEPVVLTKGSPPFAFAGECLVSASSDSGATMDLNVMTRRARYVHDVFAYPAFGVQRMRADCATFLLLNVKAAIRFRGIRVEAGRFDTVQMDVNEELVVEVSDTEARCAAFGYARLAFRKVPS
jgi:environmental stress-induced protein Ves